MRSPVGSGARVVALCSALFVTGTFAHAAPPTAAAVPADDAARKAKEAFLEGTSAFNLGLWDQAIAFWQKGYQAKPDPIFLYNIAQAYRLADNPERALFFYKNYLRNVPNAPNAAEVRDKCAQLQKLLDTKKKTREMPPVDAAVAPSAASQPSAVPAASPAPTATATEPAPVPVSSTSASSTSDEGNRITRSSWQERRRIDITANVGLQLWLAGVPGGVDPGTGVSLSAGYTLLRVHRLELRLGGRAAYSFVQEVQSTDHFISLLVDPMVRLQILRDRVAAFLRVGVGALMIAGLREGSALLDPGVLASGAMTTLEVRPGLGVEVALMKNAVLFLYGELSYGPALDPLFASSAFLRSELGLGVSLRL